MIESSLTRGSERTTRLSDTVTMTLPRNGSDAAGEGAGAGDGAGDGGVGSDEAGEGAADAGVAIRLAVTTGVGLGAGGDDPAGVGVAGVLPHATRTTPRRRDAVRRFAFICRRRWC
jgi:hypothetical protein